VVDNDNIGGNDEMEWLFKVFDIRPSLNFDEAPYIEHTLVGTRTKTTAGT
jgi:hypothetical protein